MFLFWLSAISTQLFTEHREHKNSAIFLKSLPKRLGKDIAASKKP